MKRIKSIEIKNSPFFEDIKLDFSEKLNCIMGGRGTGKSTLLYLLKSAIFQNAEEDRNIYQILKNNLGSGELSVEVEAEDGSFYRITKTFNDDPQPYKHPNSEYIPIEKIFEEIECDFYETGKIEEIGRSEKDRLQLLDKKVKPEIREFEIKVKQVQIDLDANAQDIKTYNLRLQRIEETLVQYATAEGDFQAQQSIQPIGLQDEEKKEFEDADSKEKIRKNELRMLNKLIELFNELRFDFEKKQVDLNDSLIISQEGKDSFINKHLTSELLKRTELTINLIKQNIGIIAKSIDEHIVFLDFYAQDLTDQHAIQQAEFIKIKQKFEAHREYINKYHLLSKRLSDKMSLIKDRQELNDKRLKLKEARTILIKKLNECKQAIFGIRLNAISDLNKNFEGAIMINLTFSGINHPFSEKLRDSLKGSGMHYNELIPIIVSNLSTDEFASIIHNKDISRLTSIAGIDQSRAASLINVLFETEAIYEIEMLYCDDLPEFKLRIHDNGLFEENYRKSDELSMGQRCTTVLPIIFAVSENPLIIDQPEDNLDNKFISDKIHEIIRHQKNERQLILITHNPNIPVLSESENNIFLKYDRKSSVDAIGNVDEVKNKIIELLEGGEKAFKKRKVTYGY